MKRFRYFVLLLLIPTVILFNSCGDGDAIDKKWEAEAFDIVVLAGQSNAYGLGIGSTSAEYVQDENILYLNSDFAIDIAKEEIRNHEKLNNFSLAFAKEYVNSGRLSEGRKLLIVRAAIGGTGFSDNRWTPNGDLNKKMHSLIKAALELNGQNRLVAVLWHQGETDAINGASNQAHYQSLKNFVSSIREEYSLPQLPFIAADFVPEWKAENIGSSAAIINAIKQVCLDLQSSAFVETDGLNSNNQATGNGDKIHFSRDALNILGTRYFAKFNELA